MARAVVVGAGHNGMIAALRLRALGWEVLLLEAGAALGGLAAGGSVGSARHGGWRPRAETLAPEALDGLGLDLRFEAVPPTWGVRADGSAFCLEEEPGYQAWASWVEEYRPMARHRLTEPAPSLHSDGPLWPLARTALGLRTLGRGPMQTLLRVAPSSAEDALSEHIEDPAVRAVAAGRGLLGSWMGPLSPTGAALLILGGALAGRHPVGGAPAVIDALEKSLEAARVEVRTGARVQQVLVEGGRARGVVLDGSEERAGVVLLACDPRTALLELVPSWELPVRVGYQAAEHRVRGIVGVVHLVLSEGPLVSGRSVRRLHTATHPHDVERAFDAAKHGRMPERAPVWLEVAEGGRSATAWVHGAPRHADADGLFDLVCGALDRVWPGARDAVEAWEALGPGALEQRFGLAGGHLWHGELAIDQLWSMRPGLDLSGHHTPIPGLFLGSGGTHPAGGLTGLPGHLAAHAVGAP